MRREIFSEEHELFRAQFRRFAEDEAMHFESQRPEHGLQHVEHLAAGGCDAGAGDERPGELDGVDHASNFTGFSDGATKYVKLGCPGGKPLVRKLGEVDMALS